MELNGELQALLQRLANEEITFTSAELKNFVQQAEQIMAKQQSFNNLRNHARYAFLVSSVQQSSLSLVEQLKQAVANQDYLLIQYLISQNVELNADKGAALKQAVQLGNLSLCKYLIEQGADYRLDDNAIFLLAVELGRFPIVKHLVDLGVGYHGRRDYDLIIRALNLTNNWDIETFLLNLQETVDWKKRPLRYLG